ncbi:hypothetical protein B0T09DRAFT_7476 [Sordaria sp. MPI-SDFR-AT-0083]|nr:hypothetical protein B0T09DRAFT_7476 [Sordaria sp. MPI-SDFR-AT-0083]
MIRHRCVAPLLSIRQSTRWRRSISTTTTMGTGVEAIPCGEYLLEICYPRNAGCLAMTRCGLGYRRALTLTAIRLCAMTRMGRTPSHNNTIISVLIGLMSCGVKVASHAPPIISFCSCQFGYPAAVYRRNSKRSSCFGGVAQPPFCIAATSLQLCSITPM